MELAPTRLIAEVSFTGALISTLWWLVSGVTVLFLLTGFVLLPNSGRRELGKNLLRLAVVFLLLSLALLLFGLRIDEIE